MKDMKDYIHLYIGSDCQFKARKTGNMFTRRLEASDVGHYLDEEYYSFVKPILRPLSSIASEERSSILGIYSVMALPSDEIDKRMMALEVAYLLRKSFDIFGLIDAGLAIDKTKL